ncbi:hypothetical protein HELRODRAFT_113976 [Helobdella robusta]|uniref:alpha-1,2-Mannosidase n=1 Tax=Helobdella robusta TaxID=6412 RepID=T1EFX8_HELRO|nr:hypothetical protein HELRODRAFT_113976 [Helobdella robusta]ESN98043.1 hypothetical protein HELRODRAFT_113976 [Helobdella robusta]
MQAVVDAFKHSWNNYKKYAWGYDELKPLSKTFSMWFNLGLTIVDSLDTLYIMGLLNEFEEAKSWVANSLSFDRGSNINLFECTIRVLGGLLSAFHLSGDSIFLKKAQELGDKLMPAFDTSSGVPFSDVDFSSNRGHNPAWGSESSTSEVSTIQLEFIDLSRVTNDPKYEKAAMRVTKHLHNLYKKQGLVPIYINPSTGAFRQSATITFGARGDSYYEYLLKIWMLTGDSDAASDYIEAMKGMEELLLRETSASKLLYVGELLAGNNFSPKMDHLVCFLGGNLALAASKGLERSKFMTFGRRLTDTCIEFYNRMKTGLSPEIVHFNTQKNSTIQQEMFVKTADSHNLQRPETIESLFYLYRLTGNKTYQDVGWKIFQAFEKYTKVEGGYTSIGNVQNPANVQPRNKMESFWLSETLKYFYLLFTDDPNYVSLNEYIFNTEAHLIPFSYSSPRLGDYFNDDAGKIRVTIKPKNSNNNNNNNVNNNSDNDNYGNVNDDHEDDNNK